MPSSRPTVHDVARVAGVSHATVSRVLNGHDNVATETVALVRQAISETGYVPNRLARSLRNSSTGTVGLIARERAEAFYTDAALAGIAAGANAQFSLDGLQMLQALVDSPRSEDRVISLVRGGSFDGVLLVAMVTDDPIVSTLARTGIPLVTASTPVAGSTVPSVDTDSRAGSRQITSMLRRAGRRRIVELAGPSIAPVSALRHEGFLDALSDDPDPVSVPAQRWSAEAGAAAMDELLTRAPDLDAVVAASDLLATGAIDTLRARGREVPEDVAVVGFDDAPLATMWTPAIATVRADPRALGAAMATLLTRQIRGEELTDTHLVQPVEVIWRESAGPAPQTTEGRLRSE